MNIWNIIAGLAGVLAHGFIKYANARQKEGFTFKKFLELNTLQYLTSIIGVTITTISTPGLTWIGALGIGYSGGSLVKNGLKGVEKSIKEKQNGKGDLKQPD